MQNNIAKPHTKHAQFMLAAVTFAVGGQKETNDDCDTNGVQRQSRARFDLCQDERSGGILRNIGINWRGEGGHTLESQPDPGRPLSRAKAQVMRDAVAINPIVAKKVNARITHAMAVAPPVESVAW